MPKACVTNPFKGVFDRKKLFNRNDMYILRSLIKDKVNWYLDELTHEMENLTGKRASISILWRSLRYLGITRKKLQKEAYEKSEIIRAHYLGIIGESYISNQLIFIDESAKDERSLSRFYRYSSQNIRACKKVVFVRGKRYTILPALTLDGFVAIDIFEGAYDKKRFIDFILDQVVPIMNPYPGSNSVIMMDNARIHHDANLISILEGLGCRVIFLPPYSPDYNPIETAFSVIKSWIKRNYDFMEACNDPIYSLLVACGQITLQMAQSFFKSSIYM
ncbi:hypothetical protein RclHR1_10070001 [Rhizophagus clarus]|uniref:Tc1-like transposase DDE domain-containing protein n=1 Tax=Rhizophagus clarus TaxID=94130 RepID=A0A2Z6QCD4_9GLOM|nr:hypothetical protein RclHR1_10070001 [Rhizophagus clarus]